MRKFLKFVHSLAACGMIGALAAYVVVLILAPQGSASAYADMRQVLAALCNYLLLPSMALAIVSGLLSMAAHQPFQQTRWAWAKALTGLGIFDATLSLTSSKADYAAGVARKIATGEAPADALGSALANEWLVLAVLAVLSVINVVLGVWRPLLKRATAAKPNPVKAQRRKGAQRARAAKR